MAQETRQTFYKMHSLGNDFVVIDGVTRPFEPDEEAIKIWGNRHTGIGFDQLLVIQPPTEPFADFWYRIFNADGTMAEQCGNGTRCVHLLAQKLKLTRREELTWQSAAGTLHTSNAPGQLFSTVMTVPELEHASIPFDTQHAVADDCPHQFTLNSSMGEFSFTPVSMGNPHAVIFTDNLLDTDVEGIGSALTAHPAFPQRANIGFCQVIDRQFVRLRVYERGTGETQACGSGACAAVVAAQLTGRVDHKVKVSLPGGKLRISWSGGQTPVTMSGPATFVYKGDLQ